MMKIERRELIERVCKYLKTEYVALLGQRETDIQAFIETLVNEGSLISGMSFISLSLSGCTSKWTEEDFYRSILEELKATIEYVPSETILQEEILREIANFSEHGADFQIRKVLYALGRKTTAEPLVIILQSLTQVPEEHLRNLLLLLRKYWEKRNMRNYPEKRLRFMVVGGHRLWTLCCKRRGEDNTAQESPFDMARRIFLDDLSYQELKELDTSGAVESILSFKQLTGGTPALVERGIALQVVPHDISPFFSVLENDWNALPEASKQVLKRFVEDSDCVPDYCMPDFDCPQIPKVESLWANDFASWSEAFWRGFLRLQQCDMQTYKLAWRSPIHRAFVMAKMKIRHTRTMPTFLKVDLRECSVLLEKVVLNCSYGERKPKHLEEVVSLSIQIHDSVLTPILKMILSGEERHLILEMVRQIAATSEVGWVKELEEKVTSHQDMVDDLLIDAAIWESRRLQGDFDVLLCHNDEDKPIVKKIAEQLLARGYLPWLDVWELQPGRPWQTPLQQQIHRVKAAAVFVGKNGISSWQQLEVDALLIEFHKRGCAVIPALLPEAPSEAELKKQQGMFPSFLETLRWISFSEGTPDPIDQLIWGITDKRPMASL